MSAYLVSNEIMQRACEAVLIAEDKSWDRSLAFDAEKVSLLGHELFAMNDRALIARYGDDPAEITFVGKSFRADTTRYFSETMVQRYKALACLTYQCSEGDVPKEELFGRCETALMALSQRIVEASPLYENAPWDTP